MSKSHEISNEAVEAAARVFFEAMAMSKWEDVGPLTKEAYRGDARAALAAAAPIIRAEAAAQWAEAMDGDDAASFYYTRKRELSHPYSKPMHPEHWGELDGIESAAKFLRAQAVAERPRNA